LQRSLDGRIDVLEFPKTPALERFNAWVPGAREAIGASFAPRGMVCEVRQGYKSQDSKRASADASNAASILVASYAPVLVLMSKQISGPALRLFKVHKWIILQGDLSDDPLTSTYAFSKHVMGFDLAEFLQRLSPRLRAETERVFAALLGDMKS
jgi:hypothetical protein